MASQTSLLIHGILLMMMTIVIRSAPVQKEKQTILESAIGSKSSSVKQSKDISSLNVPETIEATTSHDQKKKRDVEDGEIFKVFSDDDSEEDSFDDNVEHSNGKNNPILHATIKEVAATAHDNAEHPVETDDSNVFSDISMNPTELSSIVRRRRSLRRDDQSNNRHKRSLTPYDLLDDDEIYDPLNDLIEENSYVRPDRSFAPIYWYPPVVKRSIYSRFPSNFYDRAQWSPNYPFLNDADDGDYDDEDQLPALLSNDEDDNSDDDDYELNRYPVIIDSSRNPFDNLQLQQIYNIDDMPNEDESSLFNEKADVYDDEGEGDDLDQYGSILESENPYENRYEPYETSF